MPMIHASGIAKLFQFPCAERGGIFELKDYLARHNPFKYTAAFSVQAEVG